MKTIIRVTLLLGSLSFLAPRAQGQYFGRNPVQYENFHFKVLKTQHFDVYFYDKEAPAAAEAARMAERWYARISTVLRHQLSGRQPLILYSDHPDFEQTNVLGEQPGEGTGGVTESLKRRIILPMGASLAETDHVIGHELTHAFQYDITGVGRGSMAGGLNRVPLWFIEGMAEYMSLGPVDPNTTMWMRDAVSSPGSGTSRVTSISRTGGASRSGPIWAARTVTTSSARCCARLAGPATSRRRSRR